MKKFRLALLIAAIVLLLFLLVCAARLLLWVIRDVGKTATQTLAGEDTLWTGQAEPWALPTIDPGELSDQSYDGPDPSDAPDDQPEEELVTVPVLETAEQLAGETS